MLLGAFMMVYLGGVIAFSLLIWLLASVCFRRFDSALPLKLTGGVVLVVVLSIVAVPMNEWVMSRAEADALAFPSRVAVEMKKFKETHGRYPDKLSELKLAPRVPRLLRRGSYSNRGDNYTFGFSIPGGWLDSWNYNSQTGEWSQST